MRYESMQQVRAANAAAGGHWFNADAARFFGSRVSDTIYGGRFFVSSEQDRHGGAWGGERRYTLREALAGGRIETVGRFGMFDTRREAVAFARQCARALEQVDAGGWVSLEDQDGTVSGFFCSVSCAWPAWVDELELRGGNDAALGVMCEAPGCWSVLEVEGVAA